MIRDFMGEPIILPKGTDELMLFKCLGELEILKAKIAETLSVGEGVFRIGEITVIVISTRIILRKKSWIARIKNTIDYTPLLYQAYWLLFSNQGEKLVAIGEKDESE